MKKTTTTNRNWKMMTIDCHNHIVVEEWFESIRANYPNLAPRIKRETGERCLVIRGNSNKTYQDVSNTVFDVKARLADMQKKKIVKQMLAVIPLFFFYDSSPEASLELNRAQNDGIAGLTKDYPDHFAGLCSVPLQDPKLAAKELERAITKLGLHGVEIATCVNNLELDNKTLWPFYEAVQRLDVPIMVHPVNASFTFRLKEYHLNNVIGNPTEVSLAVARITLGGVLDAFPKLKFFFVHGGGFIPYQIGRLDQGYIVKKEERGIPAKKRPSSYISSIYFDTVIHSKAALTYLVKTHGASKILCGTDYPFDMGVLDSVSKVEQLGLTNKEQSMILCENATELFKL